MTLRPAALLGCVSLLLACQPKTVPDASSEPSPSALDAARPAESAVALDASTPTLAVTPWQRPRVALRETTTDAPTGERPALALDAEGFPALSQDGATLVFFEAQSYFGGTLDTAIGMLDTTTLHTRRIVLARRAENIGVTEAGRFAPSQRRTLQARVDKALAALGAIAWTHAPAQIGHFAAPAHDDAGAGWELIADTGDVEVSARWSAEGQIEAVRVQPGFEGMPRWSASPAPRCGYVGTMKRVPEQTLAVALVTERFVVLERAWRLGTHDCDGVQASSAFALVRR